MKVIGLKNLPNDMRVKLDDSFRKFLFECSISKVKGIKSLAELLSCHSDTILNLRKGKSYTKVEHLRKLSRLSCVTLEKTEKHIIELKTRNRQRKIKIKLPILVSPELASVIGHCMGDGNLSKRQFTFFNKQRELVDEVINNVKIAFSTNVEPKEFEKDGGWEIEFPTCIARLVALAGGPVGEKVFLPFRIPKWIRDEGTETRVAFVRALFDDEGWVKIKYIKQSCSTQRMIGINMSKNKKFVESHKLFLEDVRKILLNLGIKSSKVKEMGRTKNGISMGFIISNLINLRKFLIKISFNQEVKQQKLIECLNNSKKFHELFPNESLISNKSLLKV